MLTKRDDRRAFVVLIAVLIAICWLALSISSISPYAPYLNHQVLDGVRFDAGGAYLRLLLVFVAGWVLMTAAMMLPTSLPLVVLFHRMTRPRPDRALLVALLVAGYLAAWTLFGFVAHFGDWLLHGLVHRVPWLEAHDWVIGVTLLAVAGLYQFTPLKYACLDKCRSPLHFVMTHWRGRRERAQSFRLGVDHGLFCVGCCWSLMLLMFAFGSGNVAWMLGLGTVMAVEKNMPWGRRISVPLGVGLLGSAAVVALAAVL